MLRNERLARFASVACITIAILAGTQAPAVGAEDLSRSGQAVRDDLQSLIDDSRLLFSRSPDRGPLLRDLARAERIMRGSSNDDFQRAAELFGEELAHFGQLMHQLAELVESVPQDDPITDSGEFPNAYYPELGWAFVISGNTNAEPPTGDETATGDGVCTHATAISPEWKMGVLNIILAAEGAREIFSRICTATLEPLCIVTDIAYIAARGTRDNLFLCYDLMAEAEVKGTYLRLAHLHDDLVSMESDIATRLDQMETSVTTNIDENETLILDIDSDLTNHHANMVNRTDQVSAKIAALTRFLEEFRAEDMRMEIESSLADSDNKAVGTFQMPEALGGHLELVHAIVVDTIALLEAAGQDVGNARWTLERAEAYMAAGDWVRAYREFGGAYQAAAR